MCLGLESRTSKYQDSGSKFQVSTCGSGVLEQERDRCLLSQEQSKEQASGFKDLDLVWVSVVWVKSGVQKLSLASGTRKAASRSRVCSWKFPGLGYPTMGSGSGAWEIPGRSLQLWVGGIRVTPPKDNWPGVRGYRRRCRGRNLGSPTGNGDVRVPGWETPGP